ncbi:MAG: tetratricopeptide repeat protein [Candidatus Hydrogenedentota bacterium]
MNRLHDRHREALAALLGGGLNVAAVAAHEACLREDEEAWATYTALSAVADELQTLGEVVGQSLTDKALVDDGETLPHAATSDYVEDILTATALVDLGAKTGAATPEVDLVSDVLTATALSEAGDAARACAPAVDLVDDVLLQARRAGLGGKRNVVKLEGRAPAKAAPRRQRTIAGLWIAAAACLVLGVSAVFWGVSAAMRDTPKQLAKQDDTPDIEGATVDQAPPEDFTRDLNTSGNVAPITRAQGPRVNEEAASARDKAAFRKDEELTLGDVLQARQDALYGEESDRDLLASIASLTPEEAWALINSGDLSREELLGAVLFLPPSDAVDVLMREAGRHPEDPYLRFALAKSMGALEDTERAMMQLAAMRQADAYNGLPYYMEAQIHLREGDMANALDALQHAMEYEESYAYAGTTARGREAALAAAGMNEESAQMLAAITAGAMEYEYMRDLRASLLVQGDYYASRGDYDAADTIYNAVRKMGEQVEAGAGYFNEAIAGLETQEAALRRQRNLAELWRGSETVEAVTQSLNLLGQAWRKLERYVERYNEAFLSASHDFLNNLADVALHYGDLSETTDDMISAVLGND